MKYKLVCFDLDGTLVDNKKSIWQVVHEALKTDHEARMQTMKDYFGGKISYKEWAETDVARWIEKGLTKPQIEEIINDFEVMKNAHEILAKLREMSVRTAIISGSLKIVLDLHFPEHKFDYIFINSLKYDSEDKVIGVNSTAYDQHGKATALREICKAEGFDLNETAFVGDHDNDVEIAKIAGLSIAFNCVSESLQKAAKVEVKGKDLNDVLARIL